MKSYRPHKSDWSPRALWQSARWRDCREPRRGAVNHPVYQYASGHITNANDALLSPLGSTDSTQVLDIIINYILANNNVIRISERTFIYDKWVTDIGANFNGKWQLGTLGSRQQKKKKTIWLRTTKLQNAGCLFKILLCFILKTLLKVEWNVN